MEFIMFSVNIYILESMDHDPKRVITQKWVTILIANDHDPKIDHDLFGLGS